MNPAYSVIFFSTASGAGYGMLMLLGAFGAAGVLPPDRGFGIAAFAVALSLITAGLLASTAHLGHPERAWRALTQWRTSWLSREGLVSLVTYAPVAVWVCGWAMLGTNTGPWAWWGLASALLALSTVVCTAMIYASLKPVPRWHNRWVVPVYVMFALAQGALLLSLLWHAFGFRAAWPLWVAAGATAVAWTIKHAYWRSLDRARPVSTAGSATGLGRLGDVRQLESPHTEANFVLKEMGYTVARRHARRLRRLALVIGGAAPFVLVLTAFVAPRAAIGGLLALSVMAGAAGTLIERWLFFAEAQHVVTLYYGARAV